MVPGTSMATMVAGSMAEKESGQRRKQRRERRQLKEGWRKSSSSTFLRYGGFYSCAFILGWLHAAGWHAGISQVLGHGESTWSTTPRSIEELASKCGARRPQRSTEEVEPIAQPAQQDRVEGESFAAGREEVGDVAPRDEGDHSDAEEEPLGNPRTSYYGAEESSQRRGGSQEWCRSRAGGDQGRRDGAGGIDRWLPGRRPRHGSQEEEQAEGERVHRRTPAEYGRAIQVAACKRKSTDASRDEPYDAAILDVTGQNRCGGCGSGGTGCQYGREAIIAHCTLCCSRTTWKGPMEASWKMRRRHSCPLVLLVVSRLSRQHHPMVGSRPWKN